jgi:3-hydroxyisobutyrate dehydrogenase-like beta-hydroxyacid dehydrogenase
MKKQLVCGFIGLGSQGAPIARRILYGGYPTLIWARRPEALEVFRDSEAIVADSVTELARQAEHVAVCVVGDDGVTEICHQIFAAMKTGGRVVIHSTILPKTCISLAHEADARGITLIDAPVSGGQPAAEAGTLTVMLGATPEAVEQVRPVLETFAGLIVHVGGVGTAQKAKLINNSLLVANMGLLHSAVTAGVAEGLDRDQLIHLLGASSARSFALQVYERNPAPAAFARLQTMIEKVHLLGDVLGKNHPTYVLLRDAVAPLG